MRCGTPPRGKSGKERDQLALIERVQAYLCTKAATEYHQHIALPPFAVYLHTNDNSFDANAAFPTTPLPKVSPAEIDAVCAVFAAHGRVPHVAFLDILAPALPPALPAAGLREIRRAQVMVCTPNSLALPPLPPNTSIVTLSDHSSLGDIREGLDVNELGFDPHAPRATDEDAAHFRQTLVHSRAFVLRYNGQGVSGGMFLPIRDGVTELVGIATLLPFRKRGFAAIVTAYMTRAAFEHGADVVYLTAANEQAGRVYGRVGFQACGTFQTYRALQPE